MQSAKRNNQTVGNTGMFYVCYRLSQQGWNAMPTTRNARGVDLIIYSQDASRKFSIQVKALSRSSPVPLGKHLDNLFADFVIICRGTGDQNPECFILTPQEVRELAHRGTKEGRVSYWLQPRRYENDIYREAWNRIDSETTA